MCCPVLSVDLTRSISGLVKGEIFYARPLRGCSSYTRPLIYLRHFRGYFRANSLEMLVLVSMFVSILLNALWSPKNHSRSESFSKAIDYWFKSSFSMALSKTTEELIINGPFAKHN